MAHQTHSIPWQTLSDNLKFMHCNPRNHGITNLYSRKRPSQEKELQYFANGFCRALSKYSAIERKKYSASPSPPEPGERLISEDSVQKMAKTVLRYKGILDTSNEHDGDSALSAFECTVQRFASDTAAGESDMSDDIRDACEQTKAMLMYGEMDALFRLAAHPNVHFYRLWDEDMYANAAGFGLSKLKDSMLQAYICLNVLVLRPELYDAASRRTFIQTETRAHRATLRSEDYDYRLTAAYQRMLLCCTRMAYGSSHWEAHTYPHREFFGIPREYFKSLYSTQPTSKPGAGRIEGLAEGTFRGVHLASKADVETVANLLKAKHLPTELVLQVLEVAEYRSIGRLWHRDDPLHFVNAEELKKYLSFCWKVLVRIDMLVRECGKTLDWESEVVCSLGTLFGFGITGRRNGWPQRAMCDWTEFGNHSDPSRVR